MANREIKIYRDFPYAEQPDFDKLIKEFEREKQETDREFDKVRKELLDKATKVDLEDFLKNHDTSLIDAFKPKVIIHEEKPRDIAPITGAPPDTVVLPEASTMRDGQVLYVTHIYNPKTIIKPGVCSMHFSTDLITKGGDILKRVDGRKIEPITGRRHAGVQCGVRITYKLRVFNNEKGAGYIWENYEELQTLSHAETLLGAPIGNDSTINYTNAKRNLGINELEKRVKDLETPQVDAASFSTFKTKKETVSGEVLQVYTVSDDVQFVYFKAVKGVTKYGLRFANNTRFGKRLTIQLGNPFCTVKILGKTVVGRKEFTGYTAAQMYVCGDEVFVQSFTDLPL